MADDPIIDGIIEKLRGFVPSADGTRVELAEKDIKHLLAAAKTTLKEQPCFLELSAPLRIVGDIHGACIHPGGVRASVAIPIAAY